MKRILEGAGTPRQRRTPDPRRGPGARASTARSWSARASRWTRPDLRALVNEIMPPRATRRLRGNLAGVLLQALGRHRPLSHSVYQHAGSPEVSLRLCEASVRTADELHLPAVIEELTRLSNGLILVTGPTGTGQDDDPQLHDRRDQPQPALQNRHHRGPRGIRPREHPQHRRPAGNQPDMRSFRGRSSTASARIPT